jgi:hypothetical protein
MKFLYFFLFFWVIFALLDPDPDPSGSGSETLAKKKSGSRAGQKVPDASRSTTPALVSDTKDKLLAVVVDVLISVGYAQF